VRSKPDAPGQRGMLAFAAPTTKLAIKPRFAGFVISLAGRLGDNARVHPPPIGHLWDEFPGDAKLGTQNSQDTSEFAEDRGHIAAEGRSIPP
jgi:hypothetical protein